MRNITKVLLLIVAAFLVYVIWPRTPNLKGFDPNEMAKLTVDDWIARKDGKNFASMVARYKIYSSQFNLSPLTAYRMAQNDVAGTNALRSLKGIDTAGGENADTVAAIESKATTALTEKFAMMKVPATEGGGADALAREEVARFSLVLKGAPSEEIAGPIARIYAAEYGGTPEDFAEVASNLGYAQWMIFSDTATSPDGMSALDYTREGFKLLKEVANAAPAPAAQN
jgi:hypothetical protein